MDKIKSMYNDASRIRIRERFGFIYFLIAALAGLSICGFYTVSIYYSYCIILLYILFKKKLEGLKCDVLLLLFIFSAIVGLIMNSPPSIFRSWERLGAFILLLLCVSPLIYSIRLFQMRMYLFISSLYVLSLLSMASFVCYPLDINYMYRHDLGYLEIRSGTFSGLFNHSMTLGPASALSVIFMLWNCLSKRAIWVKVVYAVCALICFFSCILSASRGAVMACIIGVICLLCIRYRSELGRLFNYSIIVIIVGVFISLNFTDYTAMLYEKQIGNIEKGGTFASREEKWTNRIEEFKSSPLLGVGFASISLDSSDAQNYDLKGLTNDTFSQRGVVEPGSSYLAVLSMTGIIGFILLWTSVFKIVFSVYKNRHSFSALCLSILACMLLYYIVEGPILAAGNYFCFIFWLLMGVLQGLSKYKLTGNCLV